ncbi:MAG: hypothetical protein J6W94_01250 [Bacteroidales bacterium]|nr:hypothetical protein [Bacteroidales bacterium]
MRRYLNIVLAILGLALVSCSVAEGSFPKGEDWASSEQDGDGSGEYMAIVTVKKSALDTVYFQLNDEVTVYPTNYQQSYTRRERLFCDAVVQTKPTGSYTYTCTVQWAEPIEEGTVTPGSEPQWSGVEDVLDVLDDWMTTVEDGYLTVHYDTLWGSSGVQHSFRLLTGTDPANPYSLALVQDSHGDAKDEKYDGLVCFDINSLPDTGGEYIPLSLKWKSLEGMVLERTFRFKTRE